MTAGLVLEGWEVKSIRQHKVQIRDSYVNLVQGEAWLVHADITPLDTASKYSHPDPKRPRKLLLNRKEINRLSGAVHQKGYTIVVLSLFWHRNRIKCDIALAKGKKYHDKRAASRDQDWKKQKERLSKQQLRDD